MKRIATCAVLTAFFLSFFGSLASAQNALPTVGDSTEDGAKTVYEAETRYNFKDDIVEGDLVRPDGLNTRVDVHSKLSSLIKVRADFTPELIKSAEDL